MKLGIGLLPENRQIEGLILDWGIGRNITLTELPAFLKGPFLNEKKENLVSKDLAERVDTKAVTVFDKASSLSGGRLPGRSGPGSHPCGQQRKHL